MKKFLSFFWIFIIVLAFFSQFLVKGLLPIPSDTIVGLYYPFRDTYFKTNPNGLPYKNFLITDPVRQTYPWRNLSINEIKKEALPLWNPYSFAGTPLLANFQSSVFYPFNILFLILPFAISWSILILLGPLLAGLFTYLYLSNLKLRKEASFLGAVAFSFSGFVVAWMQWGTVVNTALWLPLILLSIDKIFEVFQKQNNKKIFLQLAWPIIFILSLVFSFFGGHLQTFFYLALFSVTYFLLRLILYKHKVVMLFTFAVSSILFAFVTFFQWYPTLNFILLSARNADVVGLTSPGWFIPWQNLIQFIAPDFFGNPTTLNYFGVWNYAEFIGYVGIVPIVMAFFAMFFRKDKKTLFFGITFFLSLIFALPTIFAKIPFRLGIPFISTSQPTRLLFITDFSLSVLAAFGLDYFISVKNKKLMIYILVPFSFLLIFIWGFVLVFHGNLISLENLKISKQNLILPTVLFLLTVILLCILAFFPEKNKLKEKIVKYSIYGLIILTIVDLFRFGWKFEPFTNSKYLFPSNSVIYFLQSQKQPFRIMSTDSSILPPNFSIMYNISTLDGYDPLYLERYGQLMAALARGKPDISEPFGFNRIITPQNFDSRIIDLLNVKYVLSLNTITDSKLKEVFSDGYTKVYENSRVMPRIFFVNKTLLVNNRQDAIDSLFDTNYQLNQRAVVENANNNSVFQSNWDIGQINQVDYQENSILLKTQSSGNGFMVLTDSFYPTWHATIDGMQTSIYITDFNFRGIIVPKGEHTIRFYDTLY